MDHVIGIYHKRVITLMLILVWVAMGLTMEIGGPTMLDLRLRFQSDAEEVARAVSAAGAGLFLGALVGGLFVDALGPWKDVLVCVAQIVSALVVICMPYVANLSVMWLMFFVVGICAGVTNVAGQRILLDMWQQHSAAPMHALHMGFGIGAVIAPLVANNFLAVLNFDVYAGNSTSLDNVTISSNAVTQGPIDKFSIIKESRVQYAYVTIGIVSAVLSLPLIIYPFFKFYLKRFQPNRYFKYESFGLTKASEKLCDLLNPATYADGSRPFGIFVFVIVFLYFFNIVGGEQLYGNFVRTFSVDQLKFSRDEASYLDTAYWGAFTIGRLVGSLLSHIIPIKPLFMLDAILYLTAVTLQDIFATSSHAMMWTFTAFVGFMVAPLFPACVAFANTQIEVGGIVLTLIIFASGFGDLLYIWIAGIVYQQHGPRTLLYVLQIAAFVVFVISAVFVAVTYKRPDRFKQKLQKELSEMSPISDCMETNDS